MAKFVAAVLGLVAAAGLAAADPRHRDVSVINGYTSVAALSVRPIDANTVSVLAFNLAADPFNYPSLSLDSEVITGTYSNVTRKINGTEITTNQTYLSQVNATDVAWRVVLYSVVEFVANTTVVVNADNTTSVVKSGFHNGNDTLVQEISLAPFSFHKHRLSSFNFININQTVIDGANVTVLTLQGNFNNGGNIKLIARVGEDPFTVNGNPIDPTDVKFDIEVNGFPYLRNDSSIALKLLISSSSASFSFSRVHNRFSFNGSVSVNKYGYFGWNNTVEADGTAVNVDITNATQVSNFDSFAPYYYSFLGTNVSSYVWDPTVSAGNGFTGPTFTTATTTATAIATATAITTVAASATPVPSFSASPSTPVHPPKPQRNVTVFNIDNHAFLATAIKQVDANTFNEVDFAIWDGLFGFPSLVLDSETVSVTLQNATNGKQKLSEINGTDSAWNLQIYSIVEYLPNGTNAGYRPGNDKAIQEISLSAFSGFFSGLIYNPIAVSTESLNGANVTVFTISATFGLSKTGTFKLIARIGADPFTVNGQAFSSGDVKFDIEIDNFPYRRNDTSLALSFFVASADANFDVVNNGNSFNATVNSAVQYGGFFGWNNTVEADGNSVAVKITNGTSYARNNLGGFDGFNLFYYSFVGTNVASYSWDPYLSATDAANAQQSANSAANVMASASMVLAAATAVMALLF